MRLATKISAFYLAASGALVVVLAAIALIAFRAFSLTAATAHAQPPPPPRLGLLLLPDPLLRSSGGNHPVANAQK